MLPSPELNPKIFVRPLSSQRGLLFLSLVVPMQAIIRKGGNDESQTVGIRSVFGISFSSVGSG